MCTKATRGNDDSSESHLMHIINLLLLCFGEQLDNTPNIRQLNFRHEYYFQENFLNVGLSVNLQTVPVMPHTDQQRMRSRRLSVC
jgi:hypothetical protein